MKKVIFLFLLSLVFLISCSNTSESEAKGQPDDQKQEQEQEQNTPETPDEEEPNENTQEEQDEPAVADEEIVPDNEPEQPEQPDENQNPVNPGETIGNFNLSFSGAVHQSVSMNDMKNLGGTGAANFVYNNQPVTFGEINIGIKLFPLAMVNNGIIIVWLDSFKATEALTTVHKQVFGINIPQNTEVGAGDMASANIYAFYGDMTVNVKEQLFNIDCVRAVTNVGNYDVKTNDGSNLEMTASGDLLDPSVGAAYLPYPACQ